MAKHNDLGQQGEQIAQTLLLEKGYTILETNYRYSHAEIDIIAKDKDILVFIEVKTRSDDYYGTPENFVTPQKEKMMLAVASFYMDKIQHEWEIRFDIIAIILNTQTTKKGGRLEINHIEDAFFPDWNGI